MTGRNNTDRPFYPLCPARSIRSSTVPLHATLPAPKTFPPPCFTDQLSKANVFHFTNAVHAQIYESEILY